MGLRSRSSQWLMPGSVCKGITRATVLNLIHKFYLFHSLGGIGQGDGTMSFVIGSQLPAIIKLPSNFIPVIKVG